MVEENGEMGQVEGMGRQSSSSSDQDSEWELWSFERVVSALQAETASYGCMRGAMLGHMCSVSVEMEVDQYASAIEWYGIVFTHQSLPIRFFRLTCLYQPELRFNFPYQYIFFVGFASHAYAGCAMFCLMPSSQPIASKWPPSVCSPTSPG